MKKALLGVAIVGGGLVAIAATSMYLSDRQVDQVIEQAQASISEPMQLTVLEDNNSLWHRDLTFSFQIDDAQQPIDIIIENKIDKTPWGSNISHNVRLSEQTLNAIVDEQMREFVQSRFIEQAFITGQTEVSMAGNYHSEIASLAIEERFGEIEVVLQPLTVSAQGNMSGAVTMSGQWDGLKLASTALEAMSMNFKALSFSADGEYVDGSMFVGEQLLSGEGFSMNIDSEWDQQALVLNPYQIASSGKMDDGRFQGELTLTTEGLTFDQSGSQLSVDEMRLAFGISGIDTENYKKLMQGLNEMQVTGVQSEAMTAEANTFLRNGFTVTLNDWFARLGDDTFAFNAQVNLPKNDIADISNPFSFLGLFGSVSAAADLNMDSALAEKPELNSLLMPVLMTGALVSDNDQYKMDFSLENGIAKLNGEPIPLPF